MEAQSYAAAIQALEAVRDGREEDLSGERLGFTPRHPDLRDCAEVKVPVVEEFNRKGRLLGPSHRITYREFDAADGDSFPIREVLAFEPRKDGRPFAVTAQRLGRSTGRAIEALEELPNVRPMVAGGKGPEPTDQSAASAADAGAGGCSPSCVEPSDARAAGAKPGVTPQVATTTSGPGPEENRER